MYDQEELEKVLDACPTLAWIKDTGGGLIYINTIYAQTIGLDKENIIGKTEEEVCGNGISKGYLCIGGVEYWFEVTQKDICEQGQVVGSIGIAKDITIEQKFTGEFEATYNELIQSMDVDNTYFDEDEVEGLGKIIHVMLESTNASMGSLFLADELRKDVRFIYGENTKTQTRIQYNIEAVKEEILQHFIALPEEGVSYEVEMLEQVRCKKKLTRIGIQFVVEYPICFCKEMLGIVAFYFDIPKEKVIRNDGYLRQLVKYLAITIKNFTLSGQVFNYKRESDSAELELELFFQTAKEYMSILDEEMKVVKRLGNEWERGLGWSEEDTSGLSLEVLHHPEDLEEVKNKLQRAKAGEVLIAETRCLCKTGNYRSVALNIKYEKEYQQFIIIGRDITAIKEGEKQDLLLKKAVELEEINSTLLNHVSYEFKTPGDIILHSIKALEEIEKEQNIGDTCPINLKRYLYVIRQNTYRLIKLINNLVDINHIGTGQYALKIQNENIIKLVLDIIESVKEYVEEKGLGLTYEIQRNKENKATQELIIACDPEKIEQVILNLISNAIKYTEVEGTIHLIISWDYEKVLIRVRDTGEGISDEKIDKIFNRFNQGDNELARKREGSGIGLFLVKSIVELHGGKIWVESEIGNGSEFYIELPNRKLKQNQVENTELGEVEKWNIEFSDIYN